jgi:hypothetical protein
VRASKSSANRALRRAAVKRKAFETIVRLETAK